MTMQAMVDSLVDAGFEVRKFYDTINRGYTFTISKGNLHTSAFFEYPADTSREYCDPRQREFIDFITNKWHKDHMQGAFESVKCVSLGLGDGLRATSMIDEMCTYPSDLKPHSLYISTARCGGKTAFVNTVKRYLAEHNVPYVDISKGENNMNNVMNDIAFGKPTYLVTESGQVPVRIETCTTSMGEATSFEGHMLTPAEKYIRNDIASARYDALMTDNRVRSRSGPRPWGKLQAGIKTVHFSGPVTAVIWSDGTKTLVRCKDGEVNDPEKALAMAIAKKALGTNKSGSNYYDIFKQWLPKAEEDE